MGNVRYTCHIRKKEIHLYRRNRMGKIYQNFLELIGNTPLLEVKNIEKNLGLEARILVKLEYLNPAGIVKDRAARFMIEDAE